MTTEPLQSAIAFPKKAPRCVSGSLKRYAMIQVSRRRTLATLNECSWSHPFFADLVRAMANLRAAAAARPEYPCWRSERRARSSGPAFPFERMLHREGDGTARGRA